MTTGRGRSPTSRRWSGGIRRRRGGGRTPWLTPCRGRASHHEGMPSLRNLLLTTAVVGAALAPVAAAQVGHRAQQRAGSHARRGLEQDRHVVPARSGDRPLPARQSVDGGAPAPVAVPERAGGPFDIDLGTNRSGPTYAVYTRGGDLYRLSVATGVETKITKLSSPTLVERDPTIQRGEIAFIRRDGGYDQLRIGDTTSGSRAAASWSRSVRSRAPSLPSSRSPTSSSRVVDPRPRAQPEHRSRPGRLPRVLRRRERRQRHPADLRRRHERLRLGAHQPRLGRRQPHRALHAAGVEAHLRPGLAALQHDGLGRAAARRPTSSSLDGGDGVTRATTRRPHCTVTVTGPLSHAEA